MPVTPELKRWIWKTGISRPAWATQDPVSKHHLHQQTEKPAGVTEFAKDGENNFGESFEYIRTFFLNRERTKT